MIKLRDTALRDVKFVDCKMLGMQFDKCREFLLSMSFKGCNLNLSSFYKLIIKKIRFENCSLQETDFTETDLTGGVFHNCDLSGATFDHTILERVDFRSSFNYSIDPDINRIRRAKFSLSGLSGLLQKYDIEVDDQ
jgi:uncharacterized protein YjbI with pentapeptide repeats